MALTTANPTRITAAERRKATPTGGSALLVVGMVSVVVLMLVGIALALPMLRHTSAGAAPVALADPRSHSLTLGQPIRTSFGSLTASEAQLNNGLSSEDLGGMSHGVSSLVGTGSAQVDVVVTLANTSKHPVPLAAGQFKLLTGPGASPVGKTVKVTGTTLQAGLLAAGASEDARVTFVTPTNGSALWLQYSDPAGGAQTRISLGRTGKVSAPAGPHKH